LVDVAMRDEAPRKVLAAHKVAGGYGPENSVGEAKLRRV
jgi:hypothetical protein